MKIFEFTAAREFHISFLVVAARGNFPNDNGPICWQQCPFSRCDLSVGNFVLELIIDSNLAFGCLPNSTDDCQREDDFVASTLLFLVMVFCCGSSPGSSDT